MTHSEGPKALSGTSAGFFVLELSVLKVSLPAPVTKGPTVPRNLTPGLESSADRG